MKENQGISSKKKSVYLNIWNGYSLEFAKCVLLFRIWYDFIRTEIERNTFWIFFRFNSAANSALRNGSFRTNFVNFFVIPFDVNVFPRCRLKAWNSNCSIHIVYDHIFSLGICFASVLCFGFNLFELIECVTVLIICLLNAATGWNYVRKCVRAWLCLCLSECEECGEEEAEKIPKIIQIFMQIMILFNSINCIKITPFFHSHFAKYTNVCVCMCFVAKQYAQHEMNALQTKQGNYHWIRNRYENKMCVYADKRERER